MPQTPRAQTQRQTYELLEKRLAFKDRVHTRVQIAINICQFCLHTRKEVED